MTTAPDIAEIVRRLDAALDFDVQTGSDREWSVLLAEASNARTALQSLQQDNEALREALRPFAAERLSTEGEVSDCVYRTPATEARMRADRIEQRDATIRQARSLLSSGGE